jgi:uncharacterized delta-60 repeat protein
MNRSFKASFPCVMPLVLAALFTVVKISVTRPSQSDALSLEIENLLGGATALTSTLSTPGDLDESFGESGKTTAVFFGSGAFAYAAALQSDGKIVAAGGNSTTKGFSVARFLPGGSLDTSFGTAGKVATEFNATNDFAFAQALAIQSDGKIVAGGLANNSSGVAEFAIVRYLSNGSLDSNFASSGKITTKISGIGDRVTGVQIQADGKIVAVGSAGRESAVVRYNSDGTLDNTFGSAGEIVTNFSGFRAQAVSIQPDARILVAGWLTTLDSHGGIHSSFGLVRYDAEGVIDTSFGSSGQVITAFNSEFLDCQAFAMAIQPDTRIIVAGWTTGPQGGADFALARFNADGMLDPTFGSSGRVTTDFANRGNDEIKSITLQPDGKIVAAGFSDLRLNSQLFALARYNSDGTLDGTFGLGGKLTTAFFSGGFDCNVSALLLQPDGKIVGVGWALFTNGNHFALARYIGDAGSSPTPTPTPAPTPSPSPTPTPLPLQLFLNDSGPVVNQVAALDSVLFLRDPFHFLDENNLLRAAIDPNTRVVIFVSNLQLLPGESSSSVVVRLIDSNKQNHDIPAEDVRLVPNFDFAQVIFRLPDQLPVDDFSLSVIAHGQVSNTGIIRIR